jgi:alpha-beta hydrolase superfamily lysophospholipase
MKREVFTSFDGKQLELYVWDDVVNAKAVVKIAHGMAEHCGRYDHFATFLNANGYVVVANDHRGHGATDPNTLGYAEGDMFDGNVKDQIEIVNYCANRYNLPVVLFGHSYGSFVTQAVINANPNVAAYVLSGSNYMKDFTFALCKSLAKGMMKKHGGNYPAKLLADMSFGMYEKKIPGKNNWLSRDASQVAKYNEDEWCGFVCSANFYYTFMDGISKLYKPNLRKTMALDKPILIVSGDNDPVGNYGKGVKKLATYYKRMNVVDVTTMLYDGARHELLNETNSDQVYQDVLAWLNGVVK